MKHQCFWMNGWQLIGERERTHKRDQRHQKRLLNKWETQGRLRQGREPLGPRERCEQGHTAGESVARGGPGRAGTSRIEPQARLSFWEWGWGREQGWWEKHGQTGEPGGLDTGWSTTCCHIGWEELKEVEGRAENCSEDDLSSLSQRGKKSFFPLLRHEKDVSEQHVKAFFFPVKRDSFQSIYLTTDSMADSGQLPIRPILGALEEKDRGSER